MVLTQRDVRQLRAGKVDSLHILTFLLGALGVKVLEREGYMNKHYGWSYQRCIDFTWNTEMKRGY